MTLTFYKTKSAIANTAVFVIVSGLLYFGINALIGITESSHMTEFFLDRFFGVKTFYSQLYRVVEVFAVMPMERVLFYTRNLMVPVFGISLVITARATMLKTLKRHEVLLLFLTLGYLLLGIVIYRFIIISLPLIALYSFMMIGKMMDPDEAQIFPFPKLRLIGCYVILLLFAAVFTMNLRAYGQREFAPINHSAIDVYEQLKPHIVPSDVICGGYDHQLIAGSYDGQSSDYTSSI